MITPPDQDEAVRYVILPSSDGAFLYLLQSDSGARAEYAALKTKLAREFATDRAGYTAAKAQYITGVLGQARRSPGGAP